MLGSILVVEDDQAIVDLLVEALTEEGYAVQSVSTGSDALVALAALPDLALIDLHMPGVNGWELLQAIQTRGIDVPIVVMTASSLHDGTLAAVRMYPLLLKPFELDALLECVAQQSGRHAHV